ncbi:MAG: T9SS type A sorting domain-containing protein, partial [Ignavibacteria bacterium]|nr:T9SS type A sorting domain-containing protein [Ignavibacteria bacterium]
TAVAGASFTIEFFTRSGTALGGPGGDPAGWTSLGTVPVTQGAGGSTGVSELFVTPVISLNPGDTVGVAMLFTDAGPRYFGTGAPPFQVFADTNLTLITGEGRSAPFTNGGSVFASRGLVGEIHYDEFIPVELVSFTAYVSHLANSSTVELSWATATELNNQGFFIERKTESTDWINLGFVDGNGTSTETKFYSFTDNTVTTGSYSYRLKQVDFDGTFRFYELGNVVEVSTPFTYNLSQNYPNPFNPSTTIAWQLKNDGLVTIKVYDQLGKEVATLVNEEKAAGSYEIEFNASSLASGVYYYRINAGNFVDTKKMILMK